jgi:hypothetical protein
MMVTELKYGKREYLVSAHSNVAIAKQARITFRSSIGIG